jgi:hypothetical protein
MQSVIPAPEWLTESNARQRLKQRPTLEKVKIQFRASAEFRKRLDCPSAYRENDSAEKPGPAE